MQSETFEFYKIFKRLYYWKDLKGSFEKHIKLV